MKKLLLSVVLIIFIIIVSIFFLEYLGFISSTKIHNKFSNILPTSTHGLKVNVKTPKENQSSFARIDEETVIENINDKGLKQKLVLPSNALMISTKISTSAIDEIDNLPKGVEFISGVSISSDALLKNPVQITFALPDTHQPQELAAFAYDADGSDWHLYPMDIENGIATIQATHFSGYGIIAINSDYDDLAEPNSVRSRGEENLSKIKREITTNQTLGSQEDITEAQYKRVDNILRMWYEMGVKNLLNEAQTNDEMIMNSAIEFFIWKSNVEYWGRDDVFVKEIDEGYSILSLAMKNAVNRSYEKCLDKDATQASRLIKLYALAQALDERGIEGIELEDIKDKAYNCAQFDLRITTKLIDKEDDCPDTVESYEGTISLNIDPEDLTLSGEGKLIGSKEVCGSECTIEKGTINQVVRVPKTALDLESGSSKVELLIELDPWNGVDLVMDCSYDFKGMNFGVTETNYSGWTNILFGKKDIKMQEDENHFKIVNWEVIGKGEVYARKVVEGGRFLSIADSEVTTFELLHSPK